MHRAPRPRQGRRQERPSWGSCSAPLRRDDHAAQRRQPRWRRRRAAAPLAIGHGGLCQGGHRPPVGDRAALGWEAAMLRDDADRYISLRRTLGYKLVKAERHLRAFARFAAGRDEAHIRTASILAWLATVARTPGARERRLTDLILFARFLHAADPRHAIPSADLPR